MFLSPGGDAFAHLPAVNLSCDGSICFKKCISHASKTGIRSRRDLLESVHDILAIRGARRRR